MVSRATWASVPRSRSQLLHRCPWGRQARTASFVGSLLWAEGIPGARTDDGGRDATSTILAEPTMSCLLGLSIWTCRPSPPPPGALLHAIIAQAGRPSSRERQKMYGSEGGRNHYCVAAARATFSLLENHCVSLHTLHGVFGHPRLRAIFEVYGTQCFQEM
jgi:hypothetical protein